MARPRRRPNLPAGNARPRPGTTGSQSARLAFDRGSLRLDAPRTARVPPYLTWDERVAAWRTEALNHAQLREEAARYRLDLEDDALRYFAAPGLTSALPVLRTDQVAALAAWEAAGYR